MPDAYSNDVLQHLLNTDEAEGTDQPAKDQIQHPLLEGLSKPFRWLSDTLHANDRKDQNPVGRLGGQVTDLLGVGALGNTLHRFAMGDSHVYTPEERTEATLDAIGALPLGLEGANLGRSGLRAALENSVRADGKTALGMFAGQQSATSDLNALSQAKLQKAAGKTPEEIHQATGWFQGKDGQWRYEIDDSTSNWKAEQYRKQQRAPEFKAVSTLKMARDLKQVAEANNIPIEEVIRQHEANYDSRLPDAVKGLAHSESGDKLHDMMMDAYAKFNAPLDAKLGDVLQHQRLYEAYPDLKDMPVHFNDLGPYLHGSLQPGPFPKMKLNSRNNYGSEGHKTVLHEVQHQVQHDEGLDPGESSGSILERNNIQRVDHAMLEDTVQAAIDIRNGNHFFRQANQDAAELADDASISTDDLRSHLAELKKRKPERIDAAKAHEMYTASGGEVEARTTEKRHKMSQEERKKKFPMSDYDVPLNEILLRHQR